ncbi:MAG: hypothetical protein Q8M40_02715 [Legionella sp.]|nr:hypothetical protein [Legionella sp.]
MKEWLDLFCKESEEINLTLNGKTFNKSQCEFLGQGSEKRVFKIKDSNQCFFIPHKWSSKEDWEHKIKLEKNLLDQIDSLGIKAQRFEITTLSISEAGQTPQTIHVLTTKDFGSLCEEEGISIYNYKARKDHVIGTPPDFIAIIDKFSDKLFAKKMLEKIIYEYAIAFTFDLPITVIHSPDDSEHFCFEKSNDPEMPPVVRYMFWDVVHDFYGLFNTIVPTLADFKMGNRKGEYNRPFRGFECLVNHVIDAIKSMIFHLYHYNIDYTKISDELKNNLLEAIDEELIGKSLTHAKELAVKFFEKKLTTLSDDFKTFRNQVAVFIEIMQSAISLDKPDMVEQAFRAMNLDINYISINEIEDINKFAKKYGNVDIMEFIDINLVKAKQIKEEDNLRVRQELFAAKVVDLKNSFVTEYEKKLTANKGAFFGLYSFFVKSHVNKNMSLNELVTHAQGLSKTGSGKRSREVMQHLGWLNDRNEVDKELNQYLVKN